MSEVGREGDCVTIHPSFQDVCLNRWVLEVASLTLKTLAGKKVPDLVQPRSKSRIRVSYSLFYILEMFTCFCVAW